MTQKSLQSSGRSRHPGTARGQSRGQGQGWITAWRLQLLWQCCCASAWNLRVSTALSVFILQGWTWRWGAHGEVGWYSLGSQDYRGGLLCKVYLNCWCCAVQTCGCGMILHNHFFRVAQWDSGLHWMDGCSLHYLFPYILQKCSTSYGLRTDATQPPVLGEADFVSQEKEQRSMQTGSARQLVALLARTSLSFFFWPDRGQTTSVSVGEKRGVLGVESLRGHAAGWVCAIFALLPEISLILSAWFHTDKGKVGM